MFHRVFDTFMKGFLYGPYSPVSPAAISKSTVSQAQGLKDSQSLLEFNGRQFEEEHDFLLSINENNSRVSIMSPPSSPSAEFLASSEITGARHWNPTQEHHISSVNNVMENNNLQLNSILLSHQDQDSRFVEHAISTTATNQLPASTTSWNQIFPSEESELPFTFNQEEISKIDEILQLHPINETGSEVPRKKRHGKRGKRLAKRQTVAASLPRIATKQPRNRPHLQQASEPSHQNIYQNCSSLIQPRRSSRIFDVTKKNQEEQARQDEMDIAGNPHRHEERFKIIESAIRKKDGEVCYLVEWKSSRNWNTAKEMKPYGPRSLFQASQAKLKFY